MKNYSSTKKRIFLLSGFMLAFILVFNLSTYTLYKRAKVYLDNELGERLQSIAVTLSHTVELAGPDSLSSENISPSLYSMLHMAKAENLLSNIVVLTSNGKTVVDLARFSEPGEYNPFIDLDFSAVTLAKSGFPSTTSLYKSGDLYMKSAYAPLRDSEDRVTGILSVEAGAAYFDVLKSLRGAIILVDAASFLVILMLGFIFYRQSISLDKAQEAILRGENLATMGRMVAGIAHEIRNPLSIIKTSSERVQRKYNIDDEVFSFISEEVDELNRILTGYLSFAKAEPQDLKPHSTQEIIRRCKLLIESEIEDKGIILTENLPEEDIIVNCDEKRMQQALLNILLNAMQAVDRGGKIDISLEKSRDHVTLSVEDNGCGIDQKSLKDISKPFYTTKKQGSGLGLSITHNIIKAHNGRLNIKSSPGKGTKVMVTIPMQHHGDHSISNQQEAQ